MSDWVVIPCLLALRSEFDEVAPHRDKGADGTKGDASHDSTSDHTPDEDSSSLRNKDADHINEVHALDIDCTGPWPDGRGGEAGAWFDNKIHAIIAAEKKRWNDPNDKCRLNYIIWRGTIYDKDANWAGKPYTGASSHYDHAHFSARYETECENDTSPWGVAEDDVSTQDVVTGNEEYNKRKPATDPNYPGKTFNQNEGGRNVWDWQDIPNALEGKKGPAWQAIDALHRDAIAKDEAIAKLQASVDALTAMLQQHASGIIEGGARSSDAG